MASKIKVLTDSTINKIAAGEVVENPASVVKELVENALDAGATEICIEIKGGGRQLIRISDNGCGMSPDDALLCLERHATSKIRELEDIYALHTMGFRGEAIPSIASISKFSLLTCSQDTPEKGTLVLVEGGQILSSSPAARSPGTTIEVKSLFFNIPVRKKFQKSPTYDTQEILKIISILALGYPAVQFELISDQKSILKTPPIVLTSPPREQLGERIKAVLGEGFFDAVYPISFYKEPHRLEGFIGVPSYNRHNRTGQYLFINRRAVYSPLVSFAVREGYGSALPSNRHPVFVLHLDMPGALVDINVHPQKKEVRLRQETVLKESLMEAIQVALRNVNGLPEQHPLSIPTKSESNQEAFIHPPIFTKPQSINMSYPSEDYSAWQPKPSLFPSHAETPWQQSRFYLAEEERSPTLFLDLPIRKLPPRILTTINGFIILDASSLERHSCPHYKGQDGLYLMDQKAAHTRVHYERLLKRLHGQETESRLIQPLLIPLTIDFNPLEAEAIKEHLGSLNKMGICIQQFGNHTFMIDALPEMLKKDHIEAYLLAMIQDIGELKDTRHIEREKEKQMALTACRISIPTKARLSMDEAQVLVDQLFKCEHPFQCPLGKSILAHLSYDQLISYF